MGDNNTAWTGSDGSGNAQGSNCNNWTYDLIGVTGGVGSWRSMTRPRATTASRGPRALENALCVSEVLLGLLVLTPPLRVGL